MSKHYEYYYGHFPLAHIYIIYIIFFISIIKIIYIIIIIISSTIIIILIIIINIIVINIIIGSSTSSSNNTTTLLINFFTLRNFTVGLLVPPIDARVCTKSHLLSPAPRASPMLKSGEFETSTHLDKLQPQIIKPVMRHIRVENGRKHSDVI